MDCPFEPRRLTLWKVGDDVVGTDQDGTIWFAPDRYRSYIGMNLDVLKRGDRMVERLVCNVREGKSVH